MAMSAIACNAGDRAKGTFSNLSRGGDLFRDAFTQTLALKLNLTTTQRANEKALLDMKNARGSPAGLKQALQARAALYGELLDPAWFSKNSDLSSKTKSLKNRRVARSMLAGAVLLVAQLGAHEIRKLLSSSTEENSLLKLLKEARKPVAEARETEAKASPLEVLKIVK